MMTAQEVNGTHFVPLFHPNVLKDLDFEESGLKMKYGLSSTYAGNNLELRPLNSDDFTKGYKELLSQLTEVGDLTEETYLDRFDEMRKCADSYFVIVVEDTSIGQVVASGTLAIEQKFIHGAATRGRIEDIVVDKTYRGKHLGQLLIETLTILSKKLGCYKTSLECKDPLVKFYSLFGYVKEPEQNYLCKRFFH